MRKQLFWLINCWKFDPEPLPTCHVRLLALRQWSCGFAAELQPKVLVKVSENFIIAPPSEKCRAACNQHGDGANGRGRCWGGMPRPCLQPFMPKWDPNKNLTNDKKKRKGHKNVRQRWCGLGVTDKEKYLKYVTTLKSLKLVWLMMLFLNKPNYPQYLGETHIFVLCITRIPARRGRLIWPTPKGKRGIRGSWVTPQRCWYY